MVSQSPSPQNTEEDRCLYCGPKGHFIDSCPMRPKQHDLSVMVGLLTGKNNKGSSPAKVSPPCSPRRVEGWKDWATCLFGPTTNTSPTSNHLQVFSLFPLGLTSRSLTDLTLRTSSLTCSPDNFPPPLQPLMFDHPDSLLCNWITCREIESVIHMNVNLETVILSFLRSRLSPV